MAESTLVIRWGVVAPVSYAEHRLNIAETASICTNTSVTLPQTYIVRWSLNYNVIFIVAP